MRTVAKIVMLAFLTGTLAGCIGGDDTGTVDDPGPDEDEVTGPFSVLAFIDTGINPYHVAFRDHSIRAFMHPSTYLPGFPEDAPAVNITFDHDTLSDAVKADCEEWTDVESGKVYWFPGTIVVGVITNDENTFDCGSDEDDRPVFIQGASHGTMVASRAAGAEYGACAECLVVSVQGFTVGHVTWSADQEWIDLQSNSWGPFIPLIFPTGTDPGVGSEPGFAIAVEDAASRQPSFWASGNGALTRGGVLGHPSQLDPRLTPSTIRVGAHDSGYVTVWHGSSPHIISDGCWSWAAENDSMDESTPRTGGGTSGATPFSAGIAGEIILEARRILGDNRTGVRDGVLAEGEAGLVESGPLADGSFTMDELKRVVYTTADPRPDRIDQDGDVCTPTEDPLYALYPALPVPWSDVPEGPQGIPLVGYGATTPETKTHAFEVLSGESAMPERPDEDAFFEADGQATQTLHDVFTGLP